MKIICTQENLKTGLATVGRIISASNSLPILNNILIKTENGLLKISSTNLEIAITTHIRCKVEEEGGVAAFSKTITELVNNLPNKNITLQTGETGMSVETENYHTTIKTLPAEDFPLIPNIENSEILYLDAQEFKNAMDQVVFAASTNQTQPEISGILLGMENQTLKIVATDRYRLAEKKVALKKKWGNPLEVIVPQKTALELSRIIGSQNGTVEAVLNETQISLSFNDTQIVSRLVDGQYPDYNQIIPRDFSTTVAVERRALAGALKAGGIFGQSTNSVRFQYKQDEQKLVLLTESQELGKSVIDIPANIEGPSGEVVLNYHYILDCLAVVDAGQVVVKIINDSSPSLIVPEGQSDYIYLVMPIKS